MLQFFMLMAESILLKRGFVVIKKHLKAFFISKFIKQEMKMKQPNIKFYVLYHVTYN